jgi:hypothetical protein
VPQHEAAGTSSSLLSGGLEATRSEANPAFVPGSAMEPDIEALGQPDHLVDGIN